MANIPRSGLTAVWKPSGVTSADVIRTLVAVFSHHKDTRLPSASRCKVGHGGTLDRFAEGVLVIGVGNGTKQLSRFLHTDSTKEYIACGRLGIETDTYDPTGDEVDRKPYSHVTADTLRSVLQLKFSGEIRQIPPRFSALKHNGVRMSDLTRAGIAFEPAVRVRTVKEIKLLSFDPPFFTIYVSCNAGTYIRSIVHDVGKELGTCAYVHRLIRQSVADFTEDCSLHRQSWSAWEIFSSLRQS